MNRSPRFLCLSRKEAHNDAGTLGGFKWSLQHLIERGCDGQIARVGIRANGATGDEIAGTSAGGTSGAQGAVLDGDRSRAFE